MEGAENSRNGMDKVDQLAKLAHRGGTCLRERYTCPHLRRLE
jgi:hypothetical protein